MKDYDLCVEACKHDGPGCYIPGEAEFHRGIANSPEWLRRFFFAKGKVEGIVKYAQQLNNEKYGPPKSIVVIKNERIQKSS